MNYRKWTAALPVLLSFLILLTGCQSGKDAVIAPFSTATWDTTIDDVLEMAGDDYTTTDSVYGGDCYIVPGTYLDHEGSIKYMYDEDDALMCVAFTYSDSDTDAISDLYDEICGDVTDTYGESIHTQSHYSNSGDKWVREDGNILLMRLSTENASALQYSYLHPSISRDADGNLAGEETEAAAESTTES
jgi:hypothetical protein